MPVGNMRQRANSFLVTFVFICILITVGLLYIMQKSMALSNSLVSTGMNENI